MTEPVLEEAQPRSARDKAQSPLNTSRSGDPAKANRTGEGGKASQASSSSAQPIKDPLKEGAGSETAAGTQHGAGEDSATAGARDRADEEIDDMMFAFTKLSTF
jgi:hypothetical protein